MAYVTRNEIMEQLIEARNAHSHTVNSNVQLRKEIDKLKEDKQFLEKRVHEMQAQRDEWMKLYNETKDTLLIAKETIKNLAMLGFE